MAETKCERCLYYGVCMMPTGCGCEEYIFEEEYTETKREEFHDAFISYLNSFENG